MGHELSHIADFKSKNLIQSIRTGLGHRSPQYVDKMEYHTDLIFIQHGLGKELAAYSKHVRKAMKIENWRGVDFVKKNEQNYERYMNPDTIENFTHQYAMNP